MNLVEVFDFAIGWIGVETPQHFVPVSRGMSYGLPDKIWSHRVSGSVHGVRKRKRVSEGPIVIKAQPRNHAKHKRKREGGTLNEDTGRRSILSENRPAAQDNRDGKAEERAFVRPGQHKEGDPQREERTV